MSDTSLGFHSKDGLHFRREPDGSVTVSSQVTLDEATWASAIASVCATGDNAETFAIAREFHRHTGEVIDKRLAAHHRECELAGEVMAETLRQIVAAAEGSDLDLLRSDRIADAKRAIRQWNEHQWPEG